MAHCKKCSKSLVTCSHCNGKGKHGDGRRCGICGESGKLCPGSHGGDHGN